MAEGACASWDDVISRLDCIVAQAPEPFEQDTIDNGRELIHYLRERFIPPDGFDKGYWSTFSLFWDNFEIEVFDERFETYRFFKGATDILHFSHRPGEPFSVEFLAQLRMPRLGDPAP
ncbi:hypothetical protein EV667_1480 [Ancylobacter aquaticus]|uniref:Uncharacterized protein n=1 Tax=Ancylobacter aquaticus TaxID=100 RepID=A0A4R1IAK8_ANCAQ|nr:hypothetical protein [Ancylobacter aquaticus]TCK31371.1 hypothetical protein EV667_1480 [Ancylobacter aquaticus]